MKTALRLFIIIISVLGLTIISQIGGLIFLLSVVISKKWKPKFRFKNSIIFLVLYLFTTFVIIPFLAPLFGREKIKHTAVIQPTNYMTVILNRNYVRPEMNQLLNNACLLYTSPSPRDRQKSRMPSSA